MELFEIEERRVSEASVSLLLQLLQGQRMGHLFMHSKKG